MHTSLSRVSSSCDAAEPRAAAAVVIRTVRLGAELVGARGSVRLDADAYLVTDGAAPFVSTREPRTESLAVELILPGDLATGGFLPALRSTRGPVGRRVAEIAARRPNDARISLHGKEAADWWSTLDAEERALRARASRIRCVKPATRDALFRRLLSSADFIQSHYEQPLNVELLAAVSNLSPFHFARLFALVMDETPHAFLMQKRLAVARRLIDAGLGRGDAAERAGFGCRSTLFRHLRGAAAVPS
jgi:AraC-like DNA-binding protein